MTPEQAARGLMLMQNYPQHNEDLPEFPQYKDLNCFLEMSGWENVKVIRKYILPVKIPILSAIFDNFLSFYFLQFYSINILVVLFV